MCLECVSGKESSMICLRMCSIRYRFVELYYRRSDSVHKGKVIPARVETVVLFLPDVWSCVPTRLEWDGLQQSYLRQLENKLKVDQEVEEALTADEKAPISLLNV